MISHLLSHYPSSLYSLIVFSKSAKNILGYFYPKYSIHTIEDFLDLKIQIPQKKVPSHLRHSLLINMIINSKKQTDLLYNNEVLLKEIDHKLSRINNTDIAQWAKNNISLAGSKKEQVLFDVIYDWGSWLSSNGFIDHKEYYTIKLTKVTPEMMQGAVIVKHVDSYYYEIEKLLNKCNMIYI